jgi:hypothetical protein
MGIRVRINSKIKPKGEKRRDQSVKALQTFGRRGKAELRAGATTLKALS